MPANITGVVLAGGKSLRMGFDKCRLVFEEGGIDLLTGAVRLLECFTERVIVVGREESEYESYPDDVPGTGPVGAIATALRIAGNACLVLACDMPFMTGNVLANLIAAREQRGDCLMTAYASLDSGITETMVAIYEAASMPYFEYCLERRLLKTRLVIPEKLQKKIFYDTDGALPFFSVNSPAGLAAARAVLKKQVFLPNVQYCSVYN